MLFSSYIIDVKTIPNSRHNEDLRTRHHGKLLNFRLKNKDFNSAFGKLSPTVEDIRSSVPSTTLPPRKVQDILERLRKRNILIVRDNRWSVRFW